MSKLIDEKVDWWESWLMRKSIEWESWLMRKSIDKEVDWLESWLTRKLIDETLILMTLDKSLNWF